jgi:hypothetical protein
MRRPISPSNLPTPKIDHLLRLSDDTGPAHHARHTLPDWSHGYRLEDAAGVLLVSSKYHDLFNDTGAQRLAEICAALLQTLIDDGRNVSGALDYARHPKGRATETDLAKALWALGYVAQHGPSSISEPAIDTYHQLMRAASFTDARAAAYGVLGAANYLVRFPGAFQIKRFLSKQAAIVVEFCTESGGDGAGWIERWKHADWPLAVQAVSVAARRLNDDALRETSRRLIAEIREVTSDGTVFARPGPNPTEEELPVSAAVYIDALGAAYWDGGDDELIHSIRSAADWFLGANRVGKSLYDFGTGGCHDALTAGGLNRNQGAEATMYCLMAFLTLYQLASLASVELAAEESAEDESTE